MTPNLGVDYSPPDPKPRDWTIIVVSSSRPAAVWLDASGR